EMPTLEGATEWINGEPTDVKPGDGKPIFVHFWAISCEICKKHMPTLNEWREKYPDMRFISVHMPRLQEDTLVDNVTKLVSALNLKEPVAVDNLHAIKCEWDNAYVPAYYLFDGEGKLVGRSAGENAVKFMEPNLEKLYAGSEQA
ncbi:MAG: TlpA family protein disulfide reductase, partial [Fimbriimonadaceae bacterium]